MEQNYSTEILSPWGAPLGTADLKTSHEDFIVDEVLDIEMTGEGEHLWLKVIKKGANTAWVAEQLAEYYGVESRNVQWSGLKDRHAVTTQWFSLAFPIKKELPEPQRHPEYMVLEQKRHIRKLNVGTHKANQFEIKLRNISGDTQKIINRLEQIKAQGIPNYFGSQRFGQNGNNVRRGVEWLEGQFRPKKKLQSILLSSIRSYLFNEYLSKRVKESSWLTVSSTDICKLSNSNSWFLCEDEDLKELQDRVNKKELQITGPLWGDTLQCEGDKFIKEEFSNICEVLNKKAPKSARRSLQLMLENFEFNLEEDGLKLKFQLETGAFATSVLEQVFEINDLSLVPKDQEE